MLKRIQSIKNVGNFVDYKCKDDLEFRNVSLIYAENGKGKTTLSCILHSLSINDCNVILQRKTISSTRGPEISLLFNKKEIFEFKEGKWNNFNKNIEIFNTYYVNNNIYSGLSIEIDHKKNLYDFIVGEKGVDLANQLAKCNEDLKNIKSEIAVVENAIATIAKTLPIEQFLLLKRIENIDIQIKQKEKCIEDLKNIDTFIKKSTLANLVLPKVPFSEISNILSKTIDDISSDAEQKTQELIKSRKDSEFESWLESGIAYIDDDTCPFCGQSTKNIDRIKLYKVFFGIEYKNLKSGINRQKELLNSLLSERQIDPLVEKITFNKSLFDFWSDSIQLPAYDISYESIRSEIVEIRDSVLSVIDIKINKPLEFVCISGSTLDKYEKLKCKIKELNSVIDAINKKIELKKNTLQNRNLSQEFKEKEELIICKSRFEEECDNLCRNLLGLRKRKDALEKDKADIKYKIIEYVTNVFPKYEETINLYLSNFGTSFKIKNMKEQYRGDKPSSNYDFVLDDVKIEVKAGFAHTLSEGDKSALALAFFFSKLSMDPEINNKIIVLDDPITSLDRSRMNFTKQVIIEFSKKAKQVIVLSHYPEFLSLIHQDLHGVEANAFQIQKRSGQSILTQWDVGSYTNNDYLLKYDIMFEYIKEQSDCNSQSMALSIRPLLEGYFRFRYPKVFIKGEWLGDYIKKIKDSELDNPINGFCKKLLDLEDINMFSCKFHHERPINEGDETEIYSYCKRTMDFINRA